MEKVKTVLFFGDSLTENGGASSPEHAYNAIIDSMPDFKAIQCGYGGSKFTRLKVPTPTHRFNVDFNLRFYILPENFDYIVVFGGTNDYGSSVPLGEVGVEDYYTFAGALTILIKNLTKKFGKEKIRFVLPIKRYNCDKKISSSGYPLKDYVDKEKQVLEFYDIPYLDMYDDIPAPITEEHSEYFADGLHPSDKTHLYIANHIADFLRKTENK